MKELEGLNMAGHAGDVLGDAYEYLIGQFASVFRSVMRWRSGRFSKEVSQELEVHANSLYRWVQEVEEYGESAFPALSVSL